MQKTNISWSDVVWNPTTGCTKIAQGCKNCYAETMFNRLSEMDFKGNIYKGRKFTDVQIHPERLEEPLHWRKPYRVFVDSMSDLFHEKINFEFIEKIFKVMQSCKQHTFQILTKRPERMKEFINTYYSSKDYMGNPNGNIWLGVSVSTQEDAGKNIPILLETPAAVRWVSAEPMLEEIDLRKYIHKLNWIVVGAES